MTALPEPAAFAWWFFMKPAGCAGCSVCWYARSREDRGRQCCAGSHRECRNWWRGCWNFPALPRIRGGDGGSGCALRGPPGGGPAREAGRDPDLAQRIVKACSAAPGQRATGQRIEARLQAEELAGLAGGARVRLVAATPWDLQRQGSVRVIRRWPGLLRRIHVAVHPETPPPPVVDDLALELLHPVQIERQRLLHGIVELQDIPDVERQ